MTVIGFMNSNEPSGGSAAPATDRSKALDPAAYPGGRLGVFSAEIGSYSSRTASATDQASRSTVTSPWGEISLEAVSGVNDTLAVGRGTSSESLENTPAAIRPPTAAKMMMMAAAMIPGNTSVFRSTGRCSTTRSRIRPHLSMTIRSTPDLPVNASAGLKDSLMSK